eukprot:scaffold21866_cov69-Phaeocystis_antarctica.AAC.5
MNVAELGCRLESADWGAALRGPRQPISKYIAMPATLHRLVTCRIRTREACRPVSVMPPPPSLREDGRLQDRLAGRTGATDRRTQGLSRARPNWVITRALAETSYARFKVTCLCDSSQYPSRHHRTHPYIWRQLASAALQISRVSRRTPWDW